MAAALAVSTVGCASAQAAADTFVDWEVAPAGTAADTLVDEEVAPAGTAPGMAADTFPGLKALAGARTFDPEMFLAADIVVDIALDRVMDLYQSIDLLHLDGGGGGGSS